MTCGGDGEVRIYSDLQDEDTDPQEFEVSTLYVSAMACYLTPGGSNAIAVAVEGNTVQAFSNDV